MHKSLSIAVQCHDTTMDKQNFSFSSEFLFFPECRQSALELERLTEQRKQEEEAWYRQQKLLMEAEDQRRKMVEVEEKKLTDQRARSAEVINAKLNVVPDCMIQVAYSHAYC